ncbi:putative (3R)-hydroxymyristoyl-[acyl-carrier-protein] dehydratase [Capsicum annuum]|nr:putative (3R)-hydroxymyristoyl-[acyl-carrier-protein] dehydratase [Capsicum annuum]
MINNNKEYCFHQFCFLLLIFQFLRPILALPTDTITPTQPLTKDQTLVSSDQLFELGFFTPGGANSDKWYVGIWYKEIQDRTAVWVANRANPLSSSAKSVLKITETGTLILTDGQTGNSVWSSEQKTPATNVVAQLLESGNFVVRPENDETKQSYLWQSFDYPTDTLLPGMRLGWDSKTGLNRNITSWKTPTDPAPGDYTFKINTSGLPEIFLTNKQEIMYRSGAWNGIRFSGVPEMKPTEIITFEFQFNSDEISYMFELHNKTLYSRLLVNHNGLLERYTWIPTNSIWNRFWYAPKDQCDSYTECGVSGICDTNISPICKCMVGYKPKNQIAWDLRDGSDGCVRFHKLDCETDEFNVLRNMKLPDTTWSFVDKNMNSDECESMCRKNCSCMAYTNSNISGSGSGCVIWSSELIDMRQYAAAEGGQVLYVRVSSSDAVNSSLPKKEEHLITFCSRVAKTQIDFLLLRKGDRVLCKDCKVIPNENLTTQDRLLMMDLVFKMGTKRRSGKGRPRVRWGDLTLARALEIGAKLVEMGAWEAREDVDRQAWPAPGDWWWNEKVKKKVETKKAAYVKLAESKDEEEKRVSREEYKVVKKEAKLAVTTTKSAAFERLYLGLEERGGKKGKLEHTEECQDFGYCRRFKVEEVCEAIRKMQRGRATGPDEIPMNFWKFASGAGLRFVTHLFNNIFKSAKMPEAWRWSTMIHVYKNKGDI